MNRPFAEAFIHGKHRVLGYRLRPYSFAAMFALAQIDSPFLAREGRAYDLADIQKAVRICSAIDPRSADLRPSMGDRIAYRLLNKRTEAVAALAQAFVTYIDDYESLPEFYTVPDEHRGSSRTVSAPWMLSRVANFVRLTGCDPGAAWLMPVGELIWMESSIRELEGERIRFLDPESADEASEGDAVPDTEEEIFEAACRDMGEEAARDFMDRRKHLTP